MRIVTLAQLALLPLGTIVSPLEVKDGHLVSDIQGVVQRRPAARLASKSEQYLELVDLFPDVYIEFGRVVSRKAECSYGLPGNYPHRFLVWKEPT